MMKFSKHRSKKVNKLLIKRTMTGLVLVFFAMIMLFQKDTTTELQFVRNMEEGFTHNAANQRDYLFENDKGDDVYQGKFSAHQPPIETDPNKSNLMENNEEAEHIFSSTTGETYSGSIKNTGIIYTGTIIRTGTVTIAKTGATIAKTGATITENLDCTTARNETVKNKDFVLAYQQRKDVNTMCNIEKRICINGVLGGTFEQRSCKEDIIYIYHKAEVVSYNKKVLNEYIQPNAPANAGGDFNNQGKINTTETPTTTRGTTNTPVITKPNIGQTSPSTQANCTTPRGQGVKHGQFVKAYKSSRGFIDVPCEVEIRACVSGKLKGGFINPKCTFNNTSYTEYIKAGSPTSNKEFLFFQRIKKSLKFGK